MIAGSVIIRVTERRAAWKVLPAPTGRCMHNVSLYVTDSHDRRHGLIFPLLFLSFSLIPASIGQKRVTRT